jgi:hypothetical protein
MIGAFIVFLLPLLIATVVLSGQARWAWARTMDKILRGMDIDTVKKRVGQAENHRTLAKRHATGIAALLFFTNIMSYLLPFSEWETLTGFTFLWAYLILMPHLLGLYLYHVRWNPRTLERKRKIDAEDVVYEGDYSLNADAQYAINEEGELIELATRQVEARLEESP